MLPYSHLVYVHLRVWLQQFQHLQHRLHLPSLLHLSAVQTLEIIQVAIFAFVAITLFFFDAKKQRIKLTTASLLASSVYLGWRMFYTLPTPYTWLWAIGSVLLLAEILGLLEIIPFYMIVWRVKKTSTPIVSSDFEWPSVDIFIATYNEPTTVLYKTAYACSQLTYPDPSKVKVYLCDDGHRTEVADLANHLGIHYLTRPDNKGAKAGNLNNALRCTEGELLVTFDADMIPNSSFLMRTVPFMQHRKVGFVQVPQAFYNEDIFQYNTFLSGKMPNEQDFFSHTIQNGRAEYNTVIYAGSNTLFRRSALEEIGGFLEGTITEDFATGMTIQARGWRSRYLDDELAVGLSPETFEDVLNQRIRWGRGVVQTFKRYNPLTTKGLSLAQKILYLSSLTYWFFGVYKFVYFTAPLLYAVLGWIIFIAQPSTILSIWLTQFLIMHFVFNSITGQYGKGFWRNAFDAALFPQLTYSVIMELFAREKGVNFKVTPKNKVTNQVLSFKASLVMVQLTYLVFSVLGIFRLGYLMYRDLVTYHVGFQITNDAVSMFWIWYNLAQIIVAIVIANERPRMRSHDRLALSAPVQIDRHHIGLPTIQGTMENISEGGVALVLDKPYVLPPNETLSLRLLPTSSHIQPHQVEVTAKIVSYETRSKGYRVALAFVDVSEPDYQKLLAYIYDRTGIVSYVDGNRVSYQSFVILYLKSIFRLKHAFRLSRKTPRLAVEKVAQAQDREDTIQVSDLLGNPLEHKVLNISSSHVLLQGPYTAPRLALTSVLQGKVYSFSIQAERLLRRNQVLYHIENAELPQVEAWLLSLSKLMGPAVRTGDTDMELHFPNPTVSLESAQPIS